MSRPARIAALLVAAAALGGCRGTDAARGDAASAAADATPREDGWIALFDGRTLAGWTPVGVAPDTFVVRDGTIVCNGRPEGFLRTDAVYADYVLELEWRHAAPRGNAGLFVHAEPEAAPGVPYPKSIEVQIMDGTETPAYTSQGDVFAIHGAAMTPDRPHPSGWARCLPSARRTKPAGEWNRYRVVARGDRLTLEVNGVEVAGASGVAPRAGRICLESEGAEVAYRNLRLRPLRAAASVR